MDKMTDRSESPDHHDRHATPAHARPTGASKVPPGLAADTEYVVWAVYDCNEIVSLHATESAAHLAREEHLETLRTVMREPGDAELFRNATTITPIPVHGD